MLDTEWEIWSARCIYINRMDVKSYGKKLLTWTCLSSCAHAVSWILICNTPLWTKLCCTPSDVKVSKTETSVFRFSFHLCIILHSNLLMKDVDAYASLITYLWGKIVFWWHACGMVAMAKTHTIATREHYRGGRGMDNLDLEWHRITAGHARSRVVTSRTSWTTIYQQSYRHIWDSNLWILRWQTFNPRDHLRTTVLNSFGTYNHLKS